MTFLKTIKNVIVACCDKLDDVKSEINRQNARMSNLQQQIEQIKEDQKGVTVLLEEILFTVSQSNQPTDFLEDSDLVDLSIDNPVQNKSPFEVN